MFLTLFVLLRPSKKSEEDVTRWNKNDQKRIDNYRNNAIDKHEPFM